MFSQGKGNFMKFNKSKLCRIAAFYFPQHARYPWIFCALTETRTTNPDWVIGAQTIYLCGASALLSMQCSCAPSID